MRNKFTFLALGAMLLGAFGCTQNPPVGPDTNETPAATLDITYNGVVNNSLELADVPAAGQSYTISVTSNRDWAAAPVVGEAMIPGLNATPVSGKANETVSVTITVPANTGAARSQAIEFTTTPTGEETAVTRTVTISQLAAGDNPPPPPTSTLTVTHNGTVHTADFTVDVPGTGGPVELKILSTGTNWNFVWDNTSFVTPGMGDISGFDGTEKTSTFNIAANPTEQPRNTTLTYTTEDETKTIVVTIVQAAGTGTPPPASTLTVTYNNKVYDADFTIEIPASAANYNVNVNSTGSNWLADYSEYSMYTDLWLGTPSPNSGSAGTPASHTIAVEANTGDARSAKWAFKTADNTKKITVTFAQAAGNATPPSEGPAVTKFTLDFETAYDDEVLLTFTFSDTASLRYTLVNDSGNHALGRLAPATYTFNDTDWPTYTYYQPAYEAFPEDPYCFMWDSSRPAIKVSTTDNGATYTFEIDEVVTWHGDGTKDPKAYTIRHTGAPAAN